MRQFHINGTIGGNLRTNSSRTEALFCILADEGRFTTPIPVRVTEQHLVDLIISEGELGRYIDASGIIEPAIDPRNGPELRFVITAFTLGDEVPSEGPAIPRGSRNIESRTCGHRERH